MNTRRKNAIINLFLALSIFALVSCTAENQIKEVIEIPVDTRNFTVSDIDIASCKTINLECTPKSLLYGVDDITFFKNQMFITSRGEIKIFDLDGKYLKNLGEKGRAGNEYIGASSLFIKGKDTLCIFDSQKKAINFYNSNGDFINSQALPNTTIISKLTYINDAKNSLGTYVALNTFRGIPGKEPALTGYDKDFNELFSSIKIKKRDNGSYYSTAFSHGPNNDILYSEILCDTIYTATKNGVTPRYYINFGEKAVPATINGSSDMYDRLDFINKVENRDNYAVLHGIPYEDSKYLYAPYVNGYKKTFLLKYSKGNGLTEHFALKDKAEYITFSFLKVHNGKLYFSTIPNKDSIENPTIYIYSLK